MFLMCSSSLFFLSLINSLPFFCCIKTGIDIVHKLMYLTIILSQMAEIINIYGNKILQVEKKKNTLNLSFAWI